MAGTLWKAAFVLSLPQAAIRQVLRFRYSNTTIHLVVTFQEAPFTVQLATRAFTGSTTSGTFALVVFGVCSKSMAAGKALFYLIRRYQSLASAKTKAASCG